MCTVHGNRRMSVGWGLRSNLCSGSFSITQHCDFRDVIIVLDLIFFSPAKGHDDSYVIGLL